MNEAPDYSAAYLILRTDAGDGLETAGGHGGLVGGDRVRVGRQDRRERRRAVATGRRRSPRHPDDDEDRQRQQGDRDRDGDDRRQGVGRDGRRLRGADRLGGEEVPVAERGQAADRLTDADGEIDRDDAAVGGPDEELAGRAGGAGRDRGDRLDVPGLDPALELGQRPAAPDGEGRGLRSGGRWRAGDQDEGAARGEGDEDREEPGCGRGPRPVPDGGSRRCETAAGGGGEAAQWVHGIRGIGRS